MTLIIVLCALNVKGYSPGVLVWERWSLTFVEYAIE